MRNPFRTPTQALVADLVCWLTLTVALASLAYLLTSTVLAVAASAVGAFAIIKEYRDVRSLLRIRRYANEVLEDDLENEDW